MLNWEDKYTEAKQKLKDLVEARQIPLDKIVLSFSGGKDSCLMLKMIEDLGWKNKIHVVFSNTRMEFDATYKFIQTLKSEGWNIEEIYPELPMPIIYKEYGVPFHSKFVSEMISRLQQINFDFKNDTYKPTEELLKKYNNEQSQALKWISNYKRTSFACKDWVRKILSEGIDFKVSQKCCSFLKKRPLHKYVLDNSIKLSIIGVRQDESNLRTTKYTSCILEEKGGHTKYFPLIFFTEDDVWKCIKHFNIKLSSAYTVYGCKRTGCVGCPFSSNWESELEMLKKYEPNKAKACENMYKNIYPIMKRRWDLIVQIRREQKQQRKEKENDN